METTFDLRDIILILPILVLFIASLVPVTIKLLSKNEEQRPSATLLQGLLGIIIAGFFLWLHSPDKTLYAFSNALQFDGMSKWTNSLILSIGFFSLLLSFNNINTRGNQFSEHVFLILNSMVGMLVLTWSSDLIVTFIGLEILSLSLYVLIALSHEQVLAKEAAFKYFILGSLGSAIFLYGIALIYGSAGTTYIADIAKISSELITTDTIFAVGCLLLLIGILFKISIFPFHAWTPDVYQGAPTPVTAFMSTGVKVAMFSLLIRIVSSGVFQDNQNMIEVLQWLAVLTILVGNIGAIVQSNLKRMLAYSSIAHSGYILVGIVVVAAIPSDTNAISSVVFYLLGYSLVNLGAFAFVGQFENQEEKLVLIDDIRGFGKQKPMQAFLFTLFLLSLAGIPPTIGFFGKLYLFSAAVSKGFYWIVLWGVIGSVISAYYYLRPIVAMYMQETTDSSTWRNQEVGKFIMLFMGLLVLVIGVLSSGFYSNIYFAVASLFNG